MDSNAQSVSAASVLAILKKCPSPVHAITDDRLEAAIISGRVKLHLIGNAENQALVAYEVQGREFVIVALKSVKTNQKTDLSIETAAQCEPLARKLNCSYIRFHTFRPGLVAKALSVGFLPTEFVLRKTL